MGKKKLDVMAKEREYFIHGKLDENGNVEIPGCIRNGIDEESANKIFDEMAEFAKYAFNKSHAAAYAVVSYRTAYLKAYYKEEFMAATLNSFLGNLDKVPSYIDECKRLHIDILKPDINKSFTRFTVDNGKIRFGLGSIKNVGVAVIEKIVEEREKNGEFENFTNFCERMQDEAVNKKCVESLIKAGAFDGFEQTRSTLMASFENILDTINTSSKKMMKGQVTMFDLNPEDEQINDMKYTYNTLKEYNKKELLSMEKEMLGLYITGHPLESIREQIEKNTNINTMKMRKQQIEDRTGETVEIVEGYKDNQVVKIAGIISSVKKKYTKNNKIMAFVTIEDLYGQAEIIVFESTYMEASNILLNDKIVQIEGRLSIREDEDCKIVANKITEFGEQKSNSVTIDITNLEEKTKKKLRGAIKFFSGDKNNTAICVKENEEILPCGGIYLTDRILKEFEELVGCERVLKR